MTEKELIKQLRDAAAFADELLTEFKKTVHVPSYINETNSDDAGCETCIERNDIDIDCESCMDSINE